MTIEHAREALAVNPPKQGRSQRTLDRILAATRELLFEKDFSEISVAEIVRRSESSLGAFYARFASKEALLPALYEAYSKGLENEETVWSEPATWGEADLRQRVEKFVRFVVQDYRATRPFMRPLALYARQHPNDISAESRRLSAEKHKASCAFLLDCRAQIGHPDPEAAAEFIAYIVPAIGRDRVLFGDAPHASSVQIEDERLAEELIRMCFVYLQHSGVFPC